MYSGCCEGHLLIYNFILQLGTQLLSVKGFIVKILNAPSMRDFYSSLSLIPKILFTDETDNRAEMV